MGELKSYFFDTYAFMEILQGNPLYQQYAHGVSILTSRLNLMELHFGLLRLYDPERADASYDELVRFVVEIDDATIKEASRLKHFLRKRKVSYVDCLGYTLARKLNVPFLTGDAQFEDLEGVEFVR